MLVEKRESEMTLSSGITYVYEPETVAIMINALDRACSVLPAQFSDSEYMRQKLALHIMHQVDDGENDPTRLAGSALFSVLW